jgi:two-component system chemotaxis sensor kinase CheA
VAARRKASKKSKAQREFVAEAEETLEALREGLADLMDQRTALDGGGEVEPDLLNGIFRAAHSLKGLAGMFGLDGLSSLAHHLEDVLDGLRLGRVRADAPAVDLLDEAAALFGSLLERVGEESFEADSAAPIGELVGRIEQALRQTPEQQDDLAALDLDPGLLRALTEYEEHRLRENLRRGRQLFVVETSFEILAFEEGLAELTAAIREVGELVSTLPSPGETPESQIRFALVVASSRALDELSVRMDFTETSVRAISEEPQASSSPSPAMPAAASEGAIPEEAERGSQGVAPALSGEIDSLRSLGDTVRVDINKLDELMNLVGELAIQRVQIEQIAERLSASGETARVGDELARVHKLFDRKLKELQSGVLDVRMVPLRHVFDKLSRVLRGLRRELDKNVALEVSGADTELDKLIVEQLVDPLMHVVRNAFDHAIEPESERRAAGKPAEGTIFIKASQRGNHVAIEVRDDGRGIDVAHVRAVAEARGVIEADAGLSDRETLDLIFQPGFSTREAATETSGRGVGMDVVRSNLSAMGGMVDLSTEVGRGSCVTLTLPITLAIIQALIVGASDQRFAIPLNSVLETLNVDSDAIQRSDGRELLNLRGDALPLRRLSTELALGDEVSEESKLFVVVLGLGDRRMGLVVDRLEGQQDTVIKPIQGPIRQVPGIAGATEQGGGEAILVLDVASIVDDAVRRRDAA